MAAFNVSRSSARMYRRGRRLWRRLRPRAVILTYHRVFAADTDPQLLCVSPLHFEEHLEVISRQYRPVRVRELRGLMERGRALHGSVVITFDDGYADNLYNARPLLERYAVPATVFVTTGRLGGTSEFWWDDLERLLLLSNDIPETLRVRADGKVYNLNAEPSRSVRETWKNWNVQWAETPTGRHQTYRFLQRLLKPLDEGTRAKVLRDLAREVNLQEEGRATHRPMTTADLRQLAEGDLVEVGSHTVTHAQLSARPVSEQQREIFESHRQLQDIVDKPVVSFSFPFGTREDYDADTVDLVRRAGFEQACVNMRGQVTRGTDRYRLPRFVVRDWNGEEFARRLQQMFAS